MGPRLVDLDGVPGHRRLRPRSAGAGAGGQARHRDVAREGSPADDRDPQRRGGAAAGDQDRAGRTASRCRAPGRWAARSWRRPGRRWRLPHRSPGHCRRHPLPIAGSAVTRGQTLFRLVPIQAAERDAGVDRAAGGRHGAWPGVTSRRSGPSAPSGWSRTARQAAVVGRSAGRAGGRGGGAQGRARSPGAGDARRRVERRRRHRGAGERHRAERASCGTVRPLPPAWSLIELARLATVWVRVPVYAGEAGALDTRAPAQVADARRRRRCGRRDCAVRSPPRRLPIPAPPGSTSTTPCPTRTTGSGLANAWRSA